MAGVNMKDHSYVERDGAEYIPDDVVSLDSWSDPFDQTADYLPLGHDPYRFRSGSSGSSSGLVRTSSGRRVSSVKGERGAKRKSQDNAYVSRGSGTDLIPSISSSLENSYLGDLSAAEAASYRPSSRDQKGHSDKPGSEMHAHSPSRRLSDGPSHFLSNRRHHHVLDRISLFGHRHRNPHYVDHYGRSHTSSASEPKGVMVGEHCVQFPHPHGQHHHTTSHSGGHQLRHHHPASRPLHTNGSHSHVDPHSPEKFRTKMKSMWNNVKYGMVFMFILFHAVSQLSVILNKTFKVRNVE